jgi:hypothetical protein
MGEMDRKALSDTVLSLVLELNHTFLLLTASNFGTSIRSCSSLTPIAQNDSFLPASSQRRHTSSKMTRLALCTFRVSIWDMYPLFYSLSGESQRLARLAHSSTSFDWQCAFWELSFDTISPPLQSLMPEGLSTEAPYHVAHILLYHLIYNTCYTCNCERSEHPPVRG